MIKPMLTAERAREVLDYDPQTGLLKWKVSRPGKAMWKEYAGGIGKDGYMVIKIDGRSHLLHRVVWLIFYGEFPKRHLDHANCNKSDNSISNLRLAEIKQNCWNRKVRADSKSGYKGIFPLRCGKWGAKIVVDSKHIWLGSFHSPQEANEAYFAEAKKRFGEFANRG